jgi:hypothetical protein
MIVGKALFETAGTAEMETIDTIPITVTLQAVARGATARELVAAWKSGVRTQAAMSEHFSIIDDTEEPEPRDLYGADFDKKVQNALITISDAQAAIETGEYVPSPTTQFMLNMAAPGSPIDWDAELEKITL